MINNSFVSQSRPMLISRCHVGSDEEALAMVRSLAAAGGARPSEIRRFWIGHRRPRRPLPVRFPYQPGVGEAFPMPFITAGQAARSDGTARSMLS